MTEKWLYFAKCAFKALATLKYYSYFLLALAFVSISNAILIELVKRDTSSAFPYSELF